MVKLTAWRSAVPAEATSDLESTFGTKDNWIEHTVLGDNGVLDAAELLGHLLSTICAFSHGGILRRGCDTFFRVNRVSRVSRVNRDERAPLASGWPTPPREVSA
jgi:hypothetical protein